jgi:Mg/Co/Ni transporter MgtE
LTLKEKSAFVFKHRHLIVKRREKLDESERDELARMLSYLPELATLRHFADRIYWLFDAAKDYHQASCRRAAIVRDAAFQAVPELVKVLEQVSDEKFPKIMAYLRGSVGRRVRTNNHVERTNRMVRLLEKVRYKWRRRKTLVRFVVLRLDHIWSQAAVAAVETGSPQAPQRPRKQAPDRQQPRRVA